MRSDYMTEVQNKEDIDNKKKIKPIFVTELIDASSISSISPLSKFKKKKIKREKYQVKETSIQTETEVNPIKVPNLLTPYEDTLKSISKNLKTWIFFAFSIAIVARENFFKGVMTFFVMLFLVYWIHMESHNVRNWMTISHHYHHENNNWFSHGIQILLELQFGLLFPIINEVFLEDILDKWVIILLYIFYTTVHNINYSLFHVNSTHELHHDNIYTNMGPDICDVLFQTKNQENIESEDYLEDTGHYITNIIVGTIIVVILKKMCKNEITKLFLDWWSYAVLIFITLIVMVSNTYLMNFYESCPEAKERKEHT